MTGDGTPNVENVVYVYGRRLFSMGVVIITYLKTYLRQNIYDRRWDEILKMLYMDTVDIYFRWE